MARGYFEPRDNVAIGMQMAAPAAQEAMVQQALAQRHARDAWNNARLKQQAALDNLYASPAYQTMTADQRTAAEARTTMDYGTLLEQMASGMGARRDTQGMPYWGGSFISPNTADPIFARQQALNEAERLNQAGLISPEDPRSAVAKDRYTLYKMEKNIDPRDVVSNPGKYPIGIQNQVADIVKNPTITPGSTFDIAWQNYRRGAIAGEDNPLARGITGSYTPTGYETPGPVYNNTVMPMPVYPTADPNVQTWTIEDMTLNAEGQPVQGAEQWIYPNMVTPPWYDNKKLWGGLTPDAQAMHTSFLTAKKYREDMEKLKAMMQPKKEGTEP